MKLSADERKAVLIRRAWTSAERRIVLRGFFGRLTIALEPLLCFFVFAALTVGLIFRHLAVLSPIFGLAAAGFAVYAVVMMIAPVRALLHTYGPIYIVDGYIRYRGTDDAARYGSNGYVAVLLDDRRLVFEWPTQGEYPLPETTRPALVEFSEYGGIHRIDGRSTGILPESMKPLGIGVRL